jgi:WD repeat-containing protein 91
MRTSLKKMYLVHCFKDGKTDKVKEFYETFGDDLVSSPEWHGWFALPYCKKPEEDPQLEGYFSKNWEDGFMLALHNFLSTLFQAVPVPRLMQLELEREARMRCEEELHIARAEIERCHALLKLQKAYYSGFGEHGQEQIGSEKEEEEEEEEEEEDDASEDSDDNPSPETLLSTTPPYATFSTPPPNEGVSHRNPNLPAWRFCRSEPSELICSHTKGVTSVRVSSSGQYVASAGNDGLVRVKALKAAAVTHSQLQSQQQQSSRDEPSNSTATSSFTQYGTSKVTSLAWGIRNQSCLFIGTESGSLRVWDSGNNSLICDASAANASINANATGGGGETTHDMHCVAAIVPHPTSSLFLASLISQPRLTGQLMLWNLRYNKQESVLTTGTDDVAVLCGQFNHNGKILVTGDVNGMVRLFDMGQHSAMMGWSGHSEAVTSICYTQDERSLFSASLDGTICQWDAVMLGKKLYSWRLPTSPQGTPKSTNPHFPVELCLCSEAQADAQTFAVTSQSGEIYFYSVTQPMPLATYRNGHQGVITSVDWHSSQQLLVTGSDDGSVRLGRGILTSQEG